MEGRQTQEARRFTPDAGAERLTRCPAGRPAIDLTHWPPDSPTCSATHRPMHRPTCPGPKAAAKRRRD
jgi:hypothetical protein